MSMEPFCPEFDSELMHGTSARNLSGIQGEIDEYPSCSHNEYGKEKSTRKHVLGFADSFISDSDDENESENDKVLKHVLRHVHSIHNDDLSI